MANEVTGYDLDVLALELAKETLLVGIEPFGLISTVLLDRPNVVTRPGELTGRDQPLG